MAINPTKPYDAFHDPFHSRLKTVPVQTFQFTETSPMKTQTQTFAERVAATVFSTDDKMVAAALEAEDNPVDDVTADPNRALLEQAKFDPTTVVVIVELVMQIIASIRESCPNRRGRMVSAAKAPSRFQRIRFRSKVHRELDNCCTPELVEYSGQIANAMIDEAAKADDAELTTIYDEMSDNDNWLI